MNTISSSQNDDQNSELPLEKGIQESIAPNHHEVNITDGGEFLDDALRMKDQPLEEPIKKSSQGSYKHLF